MKNAVAPISADRQSLGVVLEGIWWRLLAFVGNLQVLIVLNEHECGIGAVMVDGAGRDIARHPQVARVGLLAHRLQFLDGDVVALVRLYAAYGEIGDHSHDHEDRDADTQTLVAALHAVSIVSGMPGNFPLQRECLTMKR